MADREIVYLYRESGLEQLVQKVEESGNKADAAHKKIATSSHEASQGLEALNLVSERAQEKLREMSGEAGIAGDILAKLSPVGLAAGAALGTLVGIVGEATKAFDEHTVAHAKIQAVLTATGNAAGLTASHVQELAVEVAKSTMLSVDEVQRMSTELLAMGSVSGEQFTKTIKLAADLGAVFGSAESATLALGRALEDPAKGVDRLARAHIILDEQEKEHIKTLEQEGNLLGAKAALLAAVEAHVGGAGAAGNVGLAGAMHGLTVATHELFVEMGNSQSGLSHGFIGFLQLAASGVDKLAHAYTDLGQLEIAQAKLDAASKNRFADPAIVEDLRKHVEVLKEVIAAKEQQVKADEKLAERQAKKAEDDKAEIDRQAALAAAAKAASDAAAKHAEELAKEDAKRQQLIAGIDVERDKQERMAVAVTEGGAAVDALNLQLEIEANLRKLGAEAAPAQIQAVIDKTTQIHYAVDAQRDYNQAVADQAKEQAAADAAAQKATDAAAARLQKQLDEQAKAMQKFAQESGTHVVDALINVMEGTKKPFDGLLSYAKHIFEQIVAAALLNPIILPVIVDAIGGISSRIGGAGGVGGALSAGSGMVSLSGSAGLFGAAGLGLGAGIDTFGATYLGTGATFGSLTAAAPGSVSLASLSGATLTSILGGAALGGLAGYGITSLIGGNKTAGSIGGAATGAALMMGQPEIAAAIAAITLIGSLFGPGPSDKLQGDWVNFGSNQLTPYGYTGSKFSQENATQAGQLGQSVLGFGTILSAAGLHPNYPGNARVEVGDRGAPYRVWYGGMNGDQQGGQFQTAQDAFHAMAAEMLKSLGTIPADFQKAIDNIDWSNIKAFTDQLNEIAAFHVTQAQIHGQLEMLRDPKQYELDQLAAQFQPILDEANKLGEDTADIEELWGIKRKAIIDKYAAQITQTITQTVGGTTQTIVAAVTAVGNWSQIVGQYYTEQMNAVQAQLGAAQNLHDAWATVRDGLGAARSGLLVNAALSPLSLEGRTAEAQRQFNDAFTKAMGGDQGAAGQLGNLAQAFLGADMAFEHGNAAYAQNFADVMGKLSQAQSFAGAQVTIEQLQLNALNAILQTLQAQAKAATAGPAPNYNAADAAGLTGSYGQALASSGMSEAAFLGSAGGAPWIKARNQLIAGTTDPALLAKDLTDARAQKGQPGLGTIGADYETSVIAQMTKLGLQSYDVGGLVPRTGLAMMHAGEYVIGNRQNDQLAELKAEMAAMRAVLTEYAIRSLANDSTMNATLERVADAPFADAVISSTIGRGKVL